MKSPYVRIVFRRYSSYYTMLRAFLLLQVLDISFLENNHHSNCIQQTLLNNSKKEKCDGKQAKLFRYYLFGIANDQNPNEFYCYSTQQSFGIWLIRVVNATGTEKKTMANEQQRVEKPPEKTDLPDLYQRFMCTRSAPLHSFLGFIHEIRSHSE